MKKNFWAVIAAAAVAMVTMAGYTGSAAWADDILTSDEITVQGFQMKTDVSKEQGISFRTLCQAPDVDSTITVDDQDYTVAGMGVIYVKDPNTSGSHSDNLLGKAYTELNPQVYRQPGTDDGTGFKYIGVLGYEGACLTFGYIATDAGVVSQSDGYTTYTRTLTGMDEYVCNSLYTRAFVEATDTFGEDVLIYGTYCSLTSVASVAYKVYVGGLASSKDGHEYLYNTILNRLPETSPYYLNTTVEYGWSGTVTP